MERLQKFISSCGVCSRRKAEELILTGRVRVNGRIVDVLGFKIRPEEDVVEVDGERLKKKENVYLILNKPQGYVTTLKDPHHSKYVVHLLKGIKERVYPVGRLDKDTEGLLLLTNDGELAYRLTHPAFKVEKVYSVQLDRRMVDEDRVKLEKGIVLDGKPTQPCKIRLVKGKVYRITLKEGRKRQIKRMVQHLGYRVKYLKRIKFGPLSLKAMKRGEYRYLNKKEVALLYRCAGLDLDKR